jgi:hypothetical protein
VAQEVTPTEEFVLAGQKNGATQILVFFSDGERADPLIERTGERSVRNCPYKSYIKLNSNKGCIPSILTLFDEIAANHTVPSFKASDSAILDDRLIQLDNSLHIPLENTKARC